ncbi:M23 family metallopeptidase [Actinosynnema sp. NPDC023658]|uniref:M23 family metallopeptidase n=1 Tax=Actinosynnema sp. NPDC023658 TaxID=3155465 RepID=UPI0033E5EAF0
MSGRVAAVVVAAGALATGVGASSGLDSGDTRFIPVSTGSDLAAALVHTAAPKSADVRTVHAVEPAFEAAKLMRSEGLFARQHVDEAIRHASDGYTARQAELKRQKDAEDAEKARIAEEEARAAAQRAAEEAARRPKAVKPAEGAFTSGFGGRWGTTHYGVDIANAIGTPILSVMDGVVVEAGPASGFGLWVRVQHEDGTITVYGHMNEILVTAGQHVQAGQQIATIGNRGQSTGPHLHFEVWIGGSQKIDPVGWLGERGITL